MPDVGRSDVVEQHLSDPRPVERERRLAALARRQYGVVARDQLLGIGFTAGALRHRIGCGRLITLHPGVYAVGSQPLVARARWYAALLATRPDPALSHLSSAQARDLARERGSVHVTVARRTDRRLAGVVIHRVRSLHPADIERLAGIPCTTLARTLLDLAETEPSDRLRTIAEAAERRELLDLTAIGACIERNPGRRGIAPLRRMLDDYVSVDRANEGLETTFGRFVAEFGLPPPQRNVLVAGLEVDCWWPQAKLVVELDSREHHAHWSAAERDRERDARLMRLDIHSLRVTGRRLRRDRQALFGDIAARFEAAGEPLAGLPFR
jgi:Protein of unknown function (DUF559)